eukprot:TRINITY_DN914_c0_g1_i2.p1 TRINITY_DN914_c0_g1~~TRINITY_DN914_c0_g1_i2.p1  ORF type:complete len:236 (-),score=53.61 TRINITY_DN914_c0_g1_i2:556-1188(-)
MDNITPLTWFYLFGMNGIGAMVLDGAINCGISVGLYWSKPVPIPAFTSSLVEGYGPDLLVTSFVQTVLTWVIATALACRDVRIGFGPNKTPLSRFDPPGWFSSHPAIRRLLEPQDLLKKHPDWFKKLIAQVIRGLIIGVFGVLVFGVPVTLITHFADVSFSFKGILAFKAIYFGLHGLLLTPPVVYVPLIEGNGNPSDEQLNLHYTTNSM